MGRADRVVAALGLGVGNGFGSGTIFTHLRDVAMPNARAYAVLEGTELLEAELFRKREVDQARIAFCPAIRRLSSIPFVSAH
jgi:hypothetical protein